LFITVVLSQRDLEVVVAFGRIGKNWRHLRYCGVSGCLTEAGERLWHHAIIINATSHI